MGSWGNGTFKGRELPMFFVGFALVTSQRLHMIIEMNIWIRVTCRGWRCFMLPVRATVHLIADCLAGNTAVKWCFKFPWRDHLSFLLFVICLQRIEVLRSPMEISASVIKSLSFRSVYVNEAFSLSIFFFFVVKWFLYISLETALLNLRCIFEIFISIPEWQVVYI